MISVIIATHNGARVLPLTLEALKNVRVPEAGVEFIAADNASTDGTRKLLDEYSAVLPLRILSEPRKGKCFALNKGIAAAEGDLVVFADDDIIPEEQWLEGFTKAAADHPEAELFSGQVRHYWQKTPPKWLLRLAEEGRSYGGTPIDQPEGPVGFAFFKGANFMVRRSVLQTVRFSEESTVNLGADATTAGGGDTAFVQEASEQGYQMYYAPAACVRHIVRPHQVGLIPVLRRYVRIGRSMAINGPQEPSTNVATLFGYPRFLIRSIPIDVLRACKYWVSGNTYFAARELLDVAVTCGRVYQWRKLQEAAD